MDVGYSLQKIISKRPLFAITACGIVFFTLGTITSFFIQTLYSLPQEDTHSLRLSDKDHPLVSPLLLCSLEQKNVNEDKGLEQIVKGFIQGQKIFPRILLIIQTANGWA
jgi:hypothetical protein